MLEAHAQPEAMVPVVPSAGSLHWWLQTALTGDITRKANVILFHSRTPQNHLQLDYFQDDHSKG